MALAPGQTIAHYRIDRKIGAGGMGEVYAATDTRLNRPAAIKALPSDLAADPERLTRFRREAQLLAALGHANIASIYGLEESGGALYLAMELVEGEDLQQRLEGGALPPDEALEIATQIAAALEEAHEKGIVHRDLKPANVKVTPEGKVKVLDFGLAKALSGDPVDGSAASLSMSPTLTAHMGTQAGVIMGTASYMAPEQARGKAVDRRADIWAFGVVLYELLTGGRLFTGDTVTDVIAAVVTREPDWERLPASTGGNVRRLLRRCLQKDPRQRLRDIGDARLELEADQEPAETPGPAGTLSPRRRGGWILLAVVGVLLAAGALRALFLPEVEAPVVWSTLPAPEGSAYDFEGFLEISPDGRHVAFVADDAKGEPVLWVRDLASEEPRALPGTAGAMQPFWSPDSRSIAFFSERKLRKVGLEGGLPVALADATVAPRGGDWGEGAILYVPGWSNPVMRIDEDGGDPQPVTALEPGRMELSHRWPHLLPDGRHFLYYAVSTYPEMNPQNPSQVDQSGLYLGSLQGGEARKLLAVRSRGSYVDGRLFYVDGGALMARPFDLGTLQFTGEPVTLAAGVTQSVTALWGGALFSVSDAGSLLFVRGAPERDLLLDMTWRDRSGAELGKVGEPAPFNSFRISHDGKRVVASVGDPADLWLYDLERGTSNRFTFDAGNDENPQWSKDDASIVFVSARVISEGRFSPASLFRRPTSGVEKEKLLAELERPAVVTDVSADGRWISLEALAPGSGSDLSIGSLEDNTFETFLETPDDEGAARFSPDGRWIAYYSSSSGEVAVFVQSFPGPGGSWDVSNGPGQFPAWRADGKELFYLDTDDYLWAVPVIEGEGFRTGPPVRLFQTRVGNLKAPMPPYDVAPDGRRFLFLEAAETNADIQATVTLLQNWPALLSPTR